MVCRTAAVILRLNLSEQWNEVIKKSRWWGFKTIRNFSHFNPGDSWKIIWSSKSWLVFFPTGRVPGPHGPSLTYGLNMLLHGNLCPLPNNRPAIHVSYEEHPSPWTPIIRPAKSWNNKRNPLKLTSNICFVSLIPPAMGPISWRKHTQTMFKLHIHITIIVP